MRASDGEVLALQQWPFIAVHKWRQSMVLTVGGDALLVWSLPQTDHVLVHTTDHQAASRALYHLLLTMRTN